MNPYASARVVLPHVLDLFDFIGIPMLRAVDVGCGDMGWLKALRELRPYSELLGIDIEPYDHVPEPHRTASIAYLQTDVRTLELPQSNSPWRMSDLVISLETAEHLHEEHADHLLNIIAALTGRTAAILLWSAAVPGQGPYGAEDDHGAHHNEQPPFYWEEKLIDRGFVILRDQTENIRLLIADSPDVDPWYKGLTLFQRRP